MKTTTSNLNSLIKKGTFDYVNSDITPKNFPLQPLRSSDYKLFHFDRYISSDDVEKEMRAEGYEPANIFELLSWPLWNGKDLVVALGSVAGVDGDRSVPYLGESDSRRDLGLRWRVCDWYARCRFLGVKVSEKSKEIERGNFDEDFIARFWSQVEKTDGCWNWTGAKHTQGYGLIKSGDISTRAHRISVLMSGREIPEEYQVDHLCKNTSCVNPDHLEVVTSKENTLRGDGPTAKNSVKTHCIHGHEFTEKNTRIRKNDNGSSSRVCRVCANDRKMYE